MTSVVDICNIGLVNLGDQKIASLTDNNERARLCNLRYSDTRDAVLRSYPWSCAVSRAKLARSSTAPTWGFSFKYALPSDCLRVLDLYDWNDEHHIENGFLVTDSEQAWIKYVKRIEDPNEFDALVIHAIGLRLASEIAEALTGRPELRDHMLAKYQAVLSDARTADSSERGYVRTIYSDVFIEARL
jgi:hypothetical protein